MKGNYISNNDIGISLHAGVIYYRNSCNNTVTSNAFVENGHCAIKFRGPVANNQFYGNNFISNSYGSIPFFFDNSFENRTGVNSWDNGAEGNYWSDYTSRYPDAQKVGNSTVGKTPYTIDENNQDNHPLLEPLEFAALEMPSIEPPQEPNVPSTDNSETSTWPILVIASIALTATASVSLIVYFKKRKDSSRQNKA